VGAQTNRLWTKQFIVIMICNLLLFTNLQMLLASLPSYTKEVLHASDVTVSLVTSFFSVAAIGLRFVAARGLQKGQQGAILMIGLCIMAVSSAGYYWCGSIFFLLLLRILYGAGFGLTSTIFPTMASYTLPVHRMGEGMGYFGFSSSLAMSIGPVAGLWLLHEQGFGTLITVSFFTILTIFPLVLLIRISTPQAAKHPRDVQLSDKPKLLDQKLFLPALLHFCLAVTFGGIISFLALFGKEANIIHAEQFFLFQSLAMVIARPITGKMFDKKGPMFVLLPGAVIVFISLLSLSYADGLTSLILSAILYGLGMGAVGPSLQAWMLQLVSPERRGVASSMFYNSGDLGVAGGAMLLGFVAQATNYAMMYRFAAGAMVLFILLCLVTGTMQAKLRKRKEKASAVPM